MRSLKLPAFSRYADEVGQQAESEGWSLRRLRFTKVDNKGELP
jgi:hypothetical protein